MSFIPALITAVMLFSENGALAQEPEAAPSNSMPCPPDVVEVLGHNGTWLTVAKYGPVWRPHAEAVGADFVPFVTGGAWVLRDGQPYFSSRWLWGEIVFTVGRWTLDADEGWSWIPDARCLKRSAAAAQEDDPMPLPALRDPIKVRTIPHPIGTQFAYPYGREWGRVFPAGTVLAAPRWIAPMPTTPTTLVQPQVLRTR